MFWRVRSVLLTASFLVLTVSRVAAQSDDFFETRIRLGIDHERLTYRYAGRDFRLTDVFGNVVKDILA